MLSRIELILVIAVPLMTVAFMVTVTRRLWQGIVLLREIVSIMRWRKGNIVENQGTIPRPNIPKRNIY